MGRNTVKRTATGVRRREKAIKKTSIILIILILLLLLFFAILSLVYRGGDFVITLDPNLFLKSGIKMYDNAQLKDGKIKLYAKGIDFMDNISINWLPDDLDKSEGGSHNGENYIAYTFFIDNTGDKNLDYWYEINILDVIRNVDDAVRIMVIQNGDKKIYAKINDITKKEEPGTIAFYDKKTAILEQRKDIKPGEMDKYTVVMWIEGDDPDCLDNLIGGELKVNIRITESHVKREDKQSSSSSTQDVPSSSSNEADERSSEP